MPSPDFARLLQDVRRIAREIAAPHAAAVDRDARFPHETLAALRDARVLSAAVPTGYGGAGLTLWCHRHEPSDEPTRLQSFRMREFIRCGAPEAVRGTTAHTACLGFGLERVTPALVKTHGFELADWPAEVRARLWT